jgi:hypothetical protein
MNFYGDNAKFWVGVVKDIIDETHVTVRIFGIHPIEESELDSSDLPLATVLYPTTGPQTGSGTLSHNLEPDTWVMGVSLDDTYMNPIILAVVQGSDYSMSYDNYYSGNEFYGDYGGNYDGEFGTGNPTVDTSQTSNIPGGSNIEKAYNFVYSKLVAEGVSHDPHLHTSALIGVLRVETTNIDPAVVGGFKGRAWGICQWLNPRRATLFRKHGRTKSLEVQLNFMWWEMDNEEAWTKRRWLSATNMPDAVAGFSAFERNESWDGKRRRIKRGHPIFKKQLNFAYGAYNTLSYAKPHPKDSVYQGLG